MGLLRFMFRSSPRAIVLIAALSVIAAVAMSCLIAVVQRVMFNQLDRQHGAFALGGLTVLVVVLGYLSERSTSVLVFENTTKLRVRLCEQIVATPLEVQERIGMPRLIAVLNGEVNAMISDMGKAPGGFASMAMVAAGLTYLALLSRSLLLLLVGSLAVGSLLQALTYRRYRRLTREQTLLNRKFVEHIHGVLRGGKELRLNARRRLAFFERKLSSTADEMNAQYRGLTGVESFMTVLSTGILWVSVGLVLLAPIKTLAVTSEVRITFVMTLLFLMGPWVSSTQFLRAMQRGTQALETIESLSLRLVPQISGGEASLQTSATPAFSGTLELVDVSFRYRDAEGAEQYSVGPINLRIEPGQIVFLVGGNGSGKTTLAKLITGLYVPDSGTILLDQREVTDETREWYKQHFAAIFSDFHLFDEILDAPSDDAGAETQRYLQELEIDHKTQVSNGVVSTLRLSDGQKKRLALVVANLERRPIYLFDEWAADQDPRYRQVFYREILPGLKRVGKTALVITHDDRYFDVADRIVLLQNGRIVDSNDPAAFVTGRAVSGAPGGRT